MKRMQHWLERRGWDVFAITLTPSDGTVSLTKLAEQIATYVENTFPLSSKIDLVSYSMGGLVCREYVQRLAGSARVDRLITLSTPHHGTWLAYFNGRPACREMRPASTFLNSLNGRLESLERVEFLSIWTPFDLMILPASSSRISVGRECKQWVLAHPLMILQRCCFRQIEQFLAHDDQGQSSQLEERSRRWCEQQHLGRSLCEFGQFGSNSALPH